MSRLAKHIERKLDQEAVDLTNVTPGADLIEVDEAMYEAFAEWLVAQFIAQYQP